MPSGKAYICPHSNTFMCNTSISLFFYLYIASSTITSLHLSGPPFLCDRASTPRQECLVWWGPGSLWPGEMLTLRCQWDCLALTSLSDAMFTIPHSSGPGRFGMSTLYSSVFPHRDKSQKQLQISYNQSTIVIRNLY